jgi:PAS domain S-box-containing protein
MQSPEDELRAELARVRAELCAEKDACERVQSQLERERAHFESVFEGIGEGLLITDLDDRIQYANERMTQIYGFSREQMVGRLAYEVFLPRDEWPVLQGRNERRVAGHCDYEVQMCRNTGERVWVLIHATPLRDASGEVVGTIGVQLDVTGRKQAEIALGNSEKQWRDVFEHAVDGLVVNDFQGNLLEVNAQFCDSLGYSREELLLMNVRDVELNFEGGSVAPKWESLRAGGRATVEGRLRRRDGTTLPVEVRIGRIEWNGVPALLALVRDVSERHSREAARRELQARLRSVVGAASDAIVLADADGKIVLWNGGAHKMFGWDEDEALARNVCELMPERFRAAHRAGMSRVSEGNPPRLEGRTLSLMGLHKDGHEFSVEVTLGVWREGAHTFYASVLRDVTERQQMERELQNALWERRLLMEAVPDALFRLDVEGNFVAWNRQVEHITGLAASELEGRSAFQFFGPEHAGRVADAVSQTLAQGSFQIEAPILHANGSAIPYSFSAVLLQDEEGRVLGLVGTGRDVSERLIIEEQMRASLREKEVLLKEIHHRVKNNLQIINSLLSMQAEALGDERVKTAFSESQGRIRAMALIHETLYSAGDLGRIDVRAYCERLTGALVRSYGEEARGVEMRLDIARELFLPLDAAVPCGLIINELVTNSFKYAFPSGRRGLISVAIERQNEHRWTLCVGDNGAGMPDLNLQTVTSTGLQLVTGLCDQLEATYRVEREGGTRWTISFITA